ncbi:MAG: oligoribonuclease [Acidimicrobiia bacterium]
MTGTPPSDSPCVLMWMDLEMTGLEVTSDVIVEIAVLATDCELQPLDPGLEVVVHQSEEQLAQMGEFVRQMHERSGLLELIRSSTTSLEEAGGLVLEYLKGHVPTPATVPLCGSSIGVDRRFLARYLPDVEGHLHYRSIDVSSLKELARRWYPQAYRARPGKKEGHRALADVTESIAELAHYREHIFRPPA